MAGKARLTKNAKAVRILRAKFEKGELTGDEQPKAVWESDASFQRHELSNFRTCYNKMRIEFGAPDKNTDAACDDTEDGRFLDRRCSAGELTGSGLKRRFAAVSNDDEESETEDLEEGPGVELISGDLSFKPLINISKWTEQTTLTKQLCVAIVLPSGVGPGDFTITVVDGGHYLQLSVLWPQPLVDVLVMHRWKLSDPASDFKPYHPSVLGFEASLRDLRKRSSDSVESVARIPLPFVVSTQLVSKENLSFKETGTKMLYVHLKAAAVEEYGVVADTAVFREV